MKQAHILMIDDNQQILQGNQYFLQKHEYHVETAVNLAGARKQLSEQTPDLLILDIMLPDGSGLDFLQELRGYSEMPVLLLTSLSQADSIVSGLEQGADDYLPKPYDFEVLLARVQALLRRASHVPDLLEKGPLRLDLLSGQAFLEGEDIFLTPKQFALLLLLVKNEGRILSQEYLYETVWNQTMTSDCNALWKQMSHLNAKLIQRPDIELSLFRGEGYCLEINDSN